MQAQVRSFLTTLTDAAPVTVKARVGNGAPAFHIEGISEIPARATRERVRTAIVSSGFDFPAGHVKVTIRQTPAAYAANTIPLDLPIALAILLATKQVRRPASKLAAVGELSLDGSIQIINGLLPIARAAHQNGSNLLALPEGNINEARIAEHPPLCAVRRLEDLRSIAANEPAGPSAPSPTRVPDLCELRGHAIPQRALEIAAAGAHSILFSGRPGSGTTMLARRLPGILPPMTRDEAIAVTHYKSIAGNLRIDGLETSRPFRAPHHTISKAGLLGGGTNPIPGEVTLAHNGVLHLQGLHDFSRATLEAFAAATRDHTVEVTRRARGKEVTFELPANFQLVASTWPCACGSGSDSGCCCEEAGIERFQRYLATELQDRIDMFCSVTRPTPEEVAAGPLTSSAEVRERTIRARERQAARFDDEPYYANGQLDGSATRLLLQIPDEPHQLLSDLYRRNKLTLRGYDRTLRISRTIADLADRDEVNVGDVSEALSFLNIPKVAVPA